MQSICAAGLEWFRCAKRPRAPAAFSLGRLLRPLIDPGQCLQSSPGWWIPALYIIIISCISAACSMKRTVGFALTLALALSGCVTAEQQQVDADRYERLHAAALILLRHKLL